MRKLTRRRLLASLTALSAGGTLPLGLIRRATASDGKGKYLPRLVILHLRGALDGLAAVPPYGDPDYRAMRGPLALPAPGRRGGMIDLADGFGLHPALAPLQHYFANSEMLIFPASATSYRASFHAQGQQVLRQTDHAAGEPAADWIDRLAQVCAIGAPGPRPVAGPGMDPAGLDVMAALCHGNAAIADELPRLGWPGSVDAAYAQQATVFRAAAEQAGWQLAADDSRRVMVLDSHGWDTHVEQGGSDGRLAVSLAGLADGIVALARASGPVWRETAILVMTEFGRSIGPNSKGGTDHGLASTAFLIGGAVAGGRILGRWPGLAGSQGAPGQTAPGHVAPGHVAPGHVAPGHVAPGQAGRALKLRPVTDLGGILQAVLAQHVRLPPAAMDAVLLPPYRAAPFAGQLFRS